MAKSTKAKATPKELADRKARAAEKREREEADFKTDLSHDLELAQSALADVEKQSQVARENASVFKALVSHLTGFYQEVDKLSKNKGVLEATDLVVQTINDIVKDAKRFATGDPYLDRTKEFVPAGQNPPYSDVLMDVAERMTGKPSDAWFFEAQDGEWYFNHDRLKQRGVQESLSAE